MKYVFQLLSQVDGVRSEPVCFEKEDFAVKLKELVKEEDRAKHYVIVLATVFGETIEESQVEFSRAPLLLVSEYIAMYDFVKTGV